MCHGYLDLQFVMREARERAVLPVRDPVAAPVRPVQSPGPATALARLAGRLGAAVVSVVRLPSREPAGR
jgi:hypothetical protein